MERLDKRLANTGRWSRREIRELIRAGRVCVDGRVVRSPEEKCASTSTFQVDGMVVAGEAVVYLMLHKPAGLVSSTEDPRQPTVFSLLPEHLAPGRAFSGGAPGQGHGGAAPAHQRRPPGSQPALPPQACGQDLFCPGGRGAGRGGCGGV